MLPFRRLTRGFWLLLRLPPVLVWSGGCFFLACGTALTSKQAITLSPIGFFLLPFSLILINGLISHSANDLQDWASGTDKISPGLITGGSRTLPLGLFSTGNLKFVLITALVLLLLVSLRLFAERGPLIFVFMFIGLFVSLAYSLPPLRLSYRPGLGEWLVGFPASFTCTIGCFFALTGTLHNRFLLPVALIHSLLCNGMLMQHHLADIEADLDARPRKLTTVAWVAARWGWHWPKRVTAAYFALVLPISMAAGFSIHPFFFLSSVCSMLTITSALLTKISDPYDIAHRERQILTVIGIHALVLGFGLNVLRV